MALLNKVVPPKSLNPLKVVYPLQHKPAIAVYGSGFCVHKDYMNQGIIKQICIVIF
jgi:hypothetical protein